MAETDEKKPPVGGVEEVARIELSLLANGGVRMGATLGGRFNCSYAVLRARDVPAEVGLLLGELRSEAVMAGLRPTSAVADQPASEVVVSTV